VKTFLPKESDIKREWLLIDAADKPLGRLAVELANILRGRNKPIYTPSIDTGDFVIVINAEKVKLSGTKDQHKMYATYSGYRGGHREFSAAFVRERHPDRLILSAVRGMLPKNNLNRETIKRLKVYAGAEHPHAAQKPRTAN